MPMPAYSQQNGSGGARNILFAVLLIVSLVLVAVYAQEGESGPLHGAQTRVMGVAGRVGAVGAGVGAAADSAGEAVADATADAQTLTALREQNEELRSLLADAEEYRQEVDRLRGLLDMKQVSGATGAIANVIGRSANAWDQSITIDVGSEEGVTSGMTVMGASGVIGQVARVADHTSTVRLLTDPNSGAAVMVQSSRANGIVRGSLSGLLYLEDVDEGKLPEAGDVILTSGMGGSYERGLIVGSVVSIGESGSIVVNPNDSADMLEEVIVVFKVPQAASSASATDGNASASAQSQAAADGQVQADAEGIGYDQGSDGVDYGQTDQDYIDEGQATGDYETGGEA